MGTLIFLKRPRRAASKWEEINLILTDVRDSPHNVWPQLSTINRTKYIKCLFGRRLGALGDEMLSYGPDLYSRFPDKIRYSFFFSLKNHSSNIEKRCPLRVNVHLYEAAQMSDSQP